MSNETPQLEDGYARIANELLEAIACAGFSKRECAIVIAVIRKTYGWQKKSDEISGSKLHELTGIAATHCAEAVRSLAAKGVLIVTNGRYAQRLELNKKHAEWDMTKTVSVTKAVRPKQSEEVTKTVRETDQSSQFAMTKTVNTKDNYQKTLKKDTNKDKANRVRGVVIPDGCPLSFEIAKEFIDYRATAQKPALTQNAFDRAATNFFNVGQELGKTPDEITLTVIDRGWKSCQADWLRQKNFGNSKTASKHSGFDKIDYRAGVPKNINPMFAGGES